MFNRLKIIGDACILPSKQVLTSCTNPLRKLCYCLRMEGPNQEGLKRIQKLEIVIKGQGGPAETLGIRINGRDDFGFLLGRSEFSEKPAPESFHHVLSKVQARPEHTLYIGNSNEDAYFAKNAGVDFFYIERNEHVFAEKSWAVNVLHSLEDLFVR